jgi:hypothetical protein
VLDELLRGLREVDRAHDLVERSKRHRQRSGARLDRVDVLEKLGIRAACGSSASNS